MRSKDKKEPHSEQARQALPDSAKLAEYVEEEAEIARQQVESAARTEKQNQA